MLRQLATFAVFALLVPTALIPGLSAQVTLQRHTIENDLRAAYWVYPADVDGDGDLDLTTASFDGIDWWENDGNQNFQKHFLGSAQAAWSVFAADLDADGDIDVLGGSTADKEIVWFENKGSQFVRHVLEQNWQDPESLFAADFDGDGDNDILSCAVNDDLVAWWENKGGQNFTKHIIDNLSRAHAVYAADLDSDGDIDVIASGSSKTQWYQNDGNGGFSKKTVGPSGAWGVSAADIDGDGDLDILRTQRDNGDVDWFENDGTGSFSEHLIESGYGEAWSVVAGDVDGDGDLDVAAAGFGPNTIVLWLNNGGGNFAPAIIVDSVDTPRGVQIVDLDEDGDSDIVAAIREDRDLAWYEVIGTVVQTISISAPSNGDSLLAGSTSQISWSSTGTIESVRIEFSADSAQSWSTIAAVTPNDGLFNWQVPDTSSQMCAIRISDASDNQPIALSSGNFTIFRESDLPETVTLLSPNGGESLTVDSTFTITWATQGSVDSLALDFSVNSGQDWSVLTTAVANSGQFDWSVPDMESDFALVRIRDAQDDIPADTSDAVFSIKRFVPPPTVTLLSPNGGEELFVDSTFVVSWLSTGDLPTMRIEFSSNAGSTWSDIVSATGNTGSFAWNVPESVTTMGLIRVSALAQGGPQDASDSLFVITDLAPLLPTIVGFQPDVGPPGTEVTITGTNFNTATKVSFNGAPAPFTAVSSDTLNAIVPPTASTGRLSVTNHVGSGISASDFEVKSNPDTVVLLFSPTDDAQIKLSEANENFGSKSSFKVEKNKFKSFLKFQVVGLPEELISAEVKLFATAGSVSGGAITQVSNFFVNSQVPWNEDSLRANNAPLVEGVSLASADSVAIGDTASFDVLPAIVGDGIYSFGIASESTDQVQYASKEAPEVPALVIRALTFGNLAPVAVDDEISLLEDNAVMLDVLANDVDPDGNLAISSVSLLSQPANASVILENGSLVLTPIQDFFGEDSLRYQVSDDNGAVSNPATVRFHVQSVNDAPLAVDDVAATFVNEAVQIAILANDSDIDGELSPASVEFVESAMAGAVSVLDSVTGILSYTPKTDFTGMDTLTYIVRDDSGAVSNAAAITITVHVTNQNPIAVDDTVITWRNQSFTIAVLANDIDPENLINVSSIVISQAPQNGDVSVDRQTGNVLYIPEADYVGGDLFRYTVADESGLISNEATVLVTVLQENSPPVIGSFLPEALQLEFAPGETILFFADAMDNNNDPLTLTWYLIESLTSIGEVVSNSNEYQMNTVELEPSNYLVRFEVTDGLDTTSMEWHVDIITSVALASFKAQFVGFAGVEISWMTSREMDNSGFNILRGRSAEGRFEQINEQIIGPNVDGNYTFTDRVLGAGERLFYLLEDIDFNGNVRRHGPISIDVIPPETFEMAQNYPNPFNPETKIRFQVPAAARVVLKVFDTLGQEVRTLANERRPAGFHEIVWDARDDRGEKVASGLYFYQISYQGLKLTRRMMLMK